ncbi:hypothetical protein ARMSODRAFT_979720 [Armillaria solidipes]|uniref:Uncharacterized protein n=1 Tax=Armillaria solidipes TaxID=1076256 RepID=A0A2H3AY30_9AGAR|nr:hypothetical protein ARMSODRAFT_979720 [Armillaria solidipes]
MVCQREPSLPAGRIGKEASGFSAGCAKAYIQVKIEWHLHYTPKLQWKGRLGCGHRRGQAKQTACLGCQGAGMFGVLFEWTCVVPDEFDREVFLLWESIATEVQHCQVAGSQEPGRNMLSLDVPASVHTYIDASDHHIEGTMCPIIREVVGVPSQQNAMARSLRGCRWLRDRRLCCHQDDNIEEGDTLLGAPLELKDGGYCIIEGDGGQTEKSTSLKARDDSHEQGLCHTYSPFASMIGKELAQQVSGFPSRKILCCTLSVSDKGIAVIASASEVQGCPYLNDVFVASFKEGLKADIALGNLLEDMCGIKKTYLPDKEWSTQRVVYTITTFNVLPEEEHQGYLDQAAVGKGKRKSKAKAVKEEAEDDQDATEKDVTEDGLELTPVGPERRLALEDLQVAWENMEAIAYPFIEALGWKLNMQLSCFIGGPVPGDGGRIGATSENHKPVPKEWLNALGGHLYKLALNRFVEFVRGCYTTEDQVRQSFPNKSTETKMAVPDPNDDKDDDQVLEVEDISDADMVEEGRKRKHKAIAEGKRKKKKNSADETEKGTGKRKKKGKGKTITNMDVPLSLALPAPLPLPPSPPAPLLPRPPLLSPSLLNHEEVPCHMWDSIIMSGLNDPPRDQIASGDSRGGLPLRLSQEPPGESEHLLLPWEWEPSEKETGGKDGLLMDDMMERYLGEYDLGKGWEAMLCCWTILEGRSNFEDLKGGKKALLKVGWPDLVELWIKSARRPHPEVKAEDITLFVEDWWGWWKMIQPEWRNTESVHGLLNASHRVGAMGDWSVLDKPG